MVKSKLGTATPTMPPPKGCDEWWEYFIKNEDPPHPFKSWLEFRIFHGALKDVPYEPETFVYTVPVKARKYTPDGVDKSKMILYEVKGRFRTSEEAAKYIHIRDSNIFYELVFIFGAKNVKMPGAKQRKDGSYRTMEDWAKENNFRYTYEEELEEWLREEKS